jgi:hypothetical protein
MRKPVHLAVLGISIVVAAGSLGMTLSRYLSLRSYAPKSAARTAAVPAAQAVPATAPEQWTNLFAPSQGMKLPSRLPAANAKSVSLHQPGLPPRDPLGERDERPEGVP